MPLVEVRDLTVQFPAVRALDSVSIRFEPGEVHGLIGENGAGKSTMMRVLAGLQAPTSGQVLIDGSPVAFRGVRDAMRSGIAMIHQELNLVDDLTVAENVLLGREPLRLGVIDRKTMNATVASVLQQVGAEFSATDRLGDLSLASRQLVEIAKALASEASVLIMDEPTAVLSERETECLFTVVQSLQAKGVTVLYVSHRLAEVELLCDRVTVLRDGQFVTTRMRGDVSSEEMANLMVGRELGGFFPDRLPVNGSAPALKVEGLTDGDRVVSASFDVRPGEIVGLAGLIGAGRTEVAETLVGLRRTTSGTVQLHGKAFHATSPRQAADQGVVYVSEDRKATGLYLTLDTVENVTAANLGKYATPLLQSKAQAQSANDWIEKLGIRVGDTRAPVRLLSGGNQQKIAVAKWLDLEPTVLILDEPTRGVDVGAKRELYDLIQSLAAQGLACVVISSELMELLGLCHRIVVMREGRTVAELDGPTATEESIMKLAAGVVAV